MDLPETKQQTGSENRITKHFQTEKKGNKGKGNGIVRSYISDTEFFSIIHAFNNCFALRDKVIFLNITGQQ